jgi:CRISPR/Cas system-associated exonuclease Cas4 (RecB family)
MTEELRHLSPSKIETAMKCPEQFRLRYIEKIPEMSIRSMLAGRVIHKVMEHVLKGVVAGRAIPEANTLDDFFVNEWERQTNEEEGKENHIGWSEDPDEPLSKIYDEARAMVPFVRTEVLPVVKPKVLHGEALVEHTVKDEYETEAGDTFLVWMVLDLVEENATITDWKTTGKVSKNATQSWFQMAAYSTFISRVFDKEIVEARKVFLVFGKRPKMEVVDYRMGPSHREWFKRQAIATWKMAKSGGFVGNTNGWWCSQKFCSFHAMCQGEMS